MNLQPMRKIKKPVKLFEVKSQLGTIVCEASPCIAIALNGKSYDSISLNYTILKGETEQTIYAPEATDYRGTKRKNVLVNNLFAYPDTETLADTKAILHILVGAVQRVLIDNNWL